MVRFLHAPLAQTLLHCALVLFNDSGGADLIRETSVDTTTCISDSLISRPVPSKPPARRSSMV